MNPQLKGQIEEKIRAHQIDVYHNARVVEIRRGETVLEVRDEPQQPGKRLSVKADGVLVQMGAEPPESFLQRCGVPFRKVEGSVIPTLTQSDAPLEQYQAATANGMYLIGSLIGSDQVKRAIQDGAAVIDHILGLLPPSPGEEQLMHTFASIPGGDVDAKLRYLAACAPLLYAVPRHQLRDMALLSAVHPVGAGQTIGLEGTYATALYLVIDGQIALSNRANPQHSIILRQGEFFGEETLLDRPFAASVISVTAALLFAIPRQKILELMQRVPSLQQQIEGVQTLRCLWRSLAPDLDLDQVRWLTTQATRLAFHKDDTLFSQGEQGDAVYVLLQGSITLSGRNNEGLDYLITYLGSGAYFGEIALLHTTTDSDRREATATVASRTCQVLRIHKDAFLTFLEAHADLKKQIERERNQRVLQQAVRAMPRI
jgi:CRP-like cAMP-binding protein